MSKRTSIVLLSVVYLFCFTGIAYSQVDPCATGPFSFDPERTFVWEKDGSAWRRRPIKPEDTDTRPLGQKMLFVFAPKSVVVERGKPVEFEFYKFAESEKNHTFFYDGELGNDGVDHPRSPISAADAVKPRASRIPEEKGQLVGVDESYLFQMSSEGDLYAIYSYAGTKPPEVGDYLAPRVMAGDGEGSSTKGFRKVGSDKKFDTTGMPDGYYWFTLQKTGIFNNGANRCSKTTPPVVVEITPTPTPPPTPDPTPMPPIVSINIPVKCGSDLVATAEASDQNTPPSSLSYKWEPVREEQGDGSNSFRIAKSKLRNGEIYHFKVTVTNKYGKIANAEKDQIYACDGAAGIVYFGFAIPYSGDGAKYPKPIGSPETWVKGSSSNEQQQPYPKRPYREFYERPGIETNVPDTVESNTATIARIVNVLSIEGKKFNIWLYGYADYEKKAQKFSNQQLSEDRFRQVQRAIEAAYNQRHPNDPLDIERIKGEGRLLGLGDTNAARCGQKRYDDIQRWDRRTEIVFLEEYRPIDFQTKSSCDLHMEIKNQAPLKPNRPRRRHK